MTCRIEPSSGWIEVKNVCPPNTAEQHRLRPPYTQPHLCFWEAHATEASAKHAYVSGADVRLSIRVGKLYALGVGRIFVAVAAFSRAVCALGGLHDNRHPRISEQVGGAE